MKRTLSFALAIPYYIFADNLDNMSYKQLRPCLRRKENTDQPQ